MIAPTGVDLKVGSWRTDQRLAPSVLIASRRPTHRSKATDRPVTMAWVARRSDAFSLALHPVAPPGPSIGCRKRRLHPVPLTKDHHLITKGQKSAQRRLSTLPALSISSAHPRPTHRPPGRSTGSRRRFLCPSPLTMIHHLTTKNQKSAQRRLNALPESFISSVHRVAPPSPSTGCRRRFLCPSPLMMFHHLITKNQKSAQRRLSTLAEPCISFIHPSQLDRELTGGPNQARTIPY